MNSLFVVVKKRVKHWIDVNVWDGEDRSGCKDDWVNFEPDELQEWVDDLLEYLLDD